MGLTLITAVFVKISEAEHAQKNKKIKKQVEFRDVRVHIMVYKVNIKKEFNRNRCLMLDNCITLSFPTLYFVSYSGTASLIFGSVISLQTAAD